MRNLLLVALLAILTGCATELTSTAKDIQTVSADQKQKCKFLGLVSTEQRLGPNKPANALKKAYNDVSALGGNAIHIVTSSTDWAEGASITAEALRCNL